MEREMPTAMVGGSFDPTHWGHLHLVHTVVASTSYRRFIFVPVSRNNFKQDADPPIEAEHRLQMLRLSIASYQKRYPDDPPLECIIEECEINRGGISYTFDTVRYLYRHYMIAGRLAIVMGNDLLEGLPKWYAYEKLKQLVRFVVIQREAVSSISPGDTEGEILHLQNIMMEDSSTQIRRACAQLSADEPLPQEIASLMPEEVARYVDEHRLYRT